MSNQDKRKGEDFIKNLFSKINADVVRSQLEGAREITKEAVRYFINNGFDDEEISALLMGAMEVTPQYNPAMGRFFELQIRRALKEVRAKTKKKGGR